MIYHVVPSAEWTVSPDRPYAPASLTDDGFVHCSPDEETTLTVVNSFYGDAPRPLLALLIDEARLTAECVWEEAAPLPPPGVAEGTRFPHVYGPLDREAVERVLVVRWDEGGRATGLAEAGEGGG
ncbi:MULTISPECIES: DUF952 domain-containing protein [unclassified Streptomyces]|uniref:DUF952 domain-containing protein n=1 Tax=unclassified Streptomyces TaxID=2593676 RepID=UPI00225763D2|nr:MULTISPECIES: DUF952 domain-containing protein [unclassified Streptomyces]MCX4882231.1 DUF952 domain-containing protein [Streptomyces sp. NBC_00847]MCX5422276.1 DUF952 domain-containing protein [Streptomyces sp. NBC_00078]